MNDDLYKSPESDVAITSDEVTPLPNAIVVALFILGVSFVIGAIAAGIEYILGAALPANTFFSTIFPAFAVGIYYGNKRKAFFPRNFRIKVIVIWLALGVVIAVAVYFLLSPVFLNPVMWNSTFIFIFVGLVLLGSLFSYFALSFGEKLGINSAMKKTNKTS